MISLTGVNSLWLMIGAVMITLIMMLLIIFFSYRIGYRKGFRKGLDEADVLVKEVINTVKRS